MISGLFRAALCDERVKGDNQQQHNALDHRVHVSAKAQEAQALVHNIEQQDADDRAVDAALAAGQRSSADDGSRNAGQ